MPERALRADRWPDKTPATIPALPAEVAASARPPILQLLECLLEPAVVAASLWLVAWWIEGRVAPVWLLVSVLAFALSSPGRRVVGHHPARVYLGTLAAWAWCVGLLALAAVATWQTALLSSPVAWHWLWLTPLGQALGQVLLRRAAPWLVRLQGPPLRAVVAGLNAQGLALADRLQTTPGTGITLEGCFDDRPPAPSPGDPAHRWLGPLQDLPAYVKQHRIQLIYLSLPMASEPRIRQLLQALQDTTASVYFVPDLFVTELIQGRADAVCGLPVISVCDSPFRGWAAVTKRASDLLIASALLVLLAPWMALIALAIKIDTPGPVLFRQRRYGLDGQEIVVYKFRTMRVAEDGHHIAQAQREDPRVTRVGAWLRRTSLDELPQLWNVLQGRMSMVGPRPHAVAHNEQYRRQIRSYMVRHKVRPGITGWAQVNGFRGETDTLEKMEGRIRCDLDYLRHASLLLDLYILVRTVRVVLGDPRAY